MLFLVTFPDRERSSIVLFVSTRVGDNFGFTLQCYESDPGHYADRVAKLKRNLRLVFGWKLSKWQELPQRVPSQIDFNHGCLFAVEVGRSLINGTQFTEQSPEDLQATVLQTRWESFSLAA